VARRDPASSRDPHPLTIEKGSFRDAAEVTAIAALHLPLLAAFSPALYAELLGIARGAATTPEQIVILNHYTDLRDVPASVLHEPRRTERTERQATTPAAARRSTCPARAGRGARPDLGHARDRASRTSA
jgi:hypothetical protein